MTEAGNVPQVPSTVLARQGLASTTRTASAKQAFMAHDGIGMAAGFKGVEPKALGGLAAAKE